MFVRRDHAVAALITAAVLLTGCGSPTAPPVSSPVLSSPSPSDDDAAAFEAAEATYRAYVDAVNQIDIDAPQTYEAALELTTGGARESLKRSLEKMRVDNWTVSGASRVIAVTAAEAQDAASELRLAICLDVSGVDVLDAQDASVVDARPDRQSLRATFSFQQGRWLISKFTSNDDGETC